MRLPRIRDLSRLVALVLVTALAGLASAEPPIPPSPPGNTAPGSRRRKPDSQQPWELFLGNASHQLIAYIYRTRHPANKVYSNNDTIKSILAETGFGDWSLLSAAELAMRPDIIDIDALDVF
jgi:hypothetical protein